MLNSFMDTMRKMEEINERMQSLQRRAKNRLEEMDALTEYYKEQDRREEEERRRKATASIRVTSSYVPDRKKREAEEFRHNKLFRSGMIVIINKDREIGRNLQIIEKMMCEASIKFQWATYVYKSSFQMKKYVEEIEKGGKYESYIFIGFDLDINTRFTINDALEKEGLNHAETKKYINWITSKYFSETVSYCHNYYEKDSKKRWQNNECVATYKWLCENVTMSDYRKESLVDKYVLESANW